ncbi:MULTISPECIES: phosphate acetyltransferase [Deefgea]|uniref:Phosphate acetyltransferase n=1 Tax=Deefgea chitinilytica TaxID=570276 RepID=A0ABS2CEP9_9NEIS|nr:MULTISPECIES: phosphate acetyltransferase [Deefgea]MBM5572619.1 phosphate acetyltransferase [Deefgea chitinilytica]MBM9889855.1 phosphate acetyltransferase [Deefgea sp. CFH1-16]
MQTFFIAPTRLNVGLTSVTLGVVRCLQNQGLKVGFVKPVAQDQSACEIERSTHFARQICQLDVPDALPANYAIEQVSIDETDDLLEEIITMSMTAGKDADVLVVEGLHPDPSNPFTTQLNTEMALGLQATVIIVTDASAKTAAEEIRVTERQFRNEGITVGGVIFNKAGEQFDLAAMQAEIGELKIWGVVKFDPKLLAPRTLDVAMHLNAEIIVKGELTKRRVNETVVAARAVPEVIRRLKAGALIVSSGDRDDVILATALAASNGVQLAGLVLTHNTELNETVRTFTEMAFHTGLPVLRTDGDSFGTALAISTVPTAVPADDKDRMTRVMNSVAEQLDTEALNIGVKTKSAHHLSPPAFRYQLIQKARNANKRIVLPEGEEPRTISAAIACEEKGIARCVLLGKRAVIESIAATQGLTIPASLEILDPDEIRAKYVAPMVELRKSKGLTEIQALRQLEDNVVLGTMMLAIDEVDGLVSGAIHTTANTIRPALQLIKTAPGSSIVSSVFFMLMPEQVLVYGDCAVNPNPDAEQLAEIAAQSAYSAKAFGIEPKVAMISYSTGQSGTGVDVDKVRSATEIARARHPQLMIDGPLQYDAASVWEVGQQKAPGSLVAGQATVFVFPDLNTGNTTYKAVQRSADVVSVGPMLQGLRKPVNDLSRGALVDDIVFTIALTAIQAEQMIGQ